jgi:hypothetical protein
MFFISKFQLEALLVSSFADFGITAYNITKFINDTMYKPEISRI